MPGSASRWNGAACVVDSSGRIIREAEVASEPEALIGFFAELEHFRLDRNLVSIPTPSSM
jgi:hypothetical protein